MPSIHYPFAIQELEMTIDVGFGWLPTDLAHKAKQSDLYSFDGWLRTYFPYVSATISVETVEVELPTDPQFINWYNQGNKSACVGASWSQYMAIVNLPQLGAKNYDWWKLYCKACEIDNDPQTSCARDIGAYINYGGDVLRKFGLWEKGEENPDPEDGIKEYYQARNADEGRAGFALGRPLEFGVPWFAKWMSPIQKNGEWWIPPKSTWGNNVLGGHAIMCRSASDSRQAFKLVNTWGSQYPEVWIAYSDVNYLLSNVGAECYIAIDIENTPTPVEDKFTVQAVYNNKIYTGVLELQQ